MNKICLSFLVTVVCVGTVMAQSEYVSKLKAIPKRGATLYGVVEADGKPLEGVVVSDGEKVTVTDKKGVYQLNSRKPEGLVFISVPTGYSASRNDIVPQFWAKLSEPAEQAERHDFILQKEDQSRYALVAFTDPHLYGKRRDLATFKKYIGKVSALCDSLERAGVPVYSISMGDMSYNDYWYETGVDLAYTRRFMTDAGWPVALFNLLGNHDYDGATLAGDSTRIAASMKYRDVYGPRYYSFNIGNEHYVVLENINFKNTPTKGSKLEGIAGKLDYKEDLNSEELDWLEKDLARVSPDRHIVLALHSPMFKEEKLTGKAKFNLGKENSQRLLDILKPYGNVTILSGHTHRQRMLEIPTEKGSITDHNLLSASGAIWWNSSLGQKNLAFDGNPVGFKLFEIEGDSVQWSFLPFEYAQENQFKVWNSEELKRLISEDNEAQTFRRHYPNWSCYENLPEGSRLVQVWDHDPKGKLRAEANGKELEIEEVWEVHPDYYIRTAIPMSVWSGDYKKTFINPRCARMFVVKSPIGTTPTITWTDRFGRVYTE